VSRIGIKKEKLFCLTPSNIPVFIKYGQIMVA
jgi:hypothetical protein